jgi:hypothetical protein
LAALGFTAAHVRRKELEQAEDAFDSVPPEFVDTQAIWMTPRREADAAGPAVHVGQDRFDTRLVAET